MATKTVGHRLADRVAREHGFDDLGAWVLALRGARRWTPAPSWESVAARLGEATDGEIAITGPGLQLWFRDEIAAERAAGHREQGEADDVEDEPPALAAVS